jgi:hypothetical protein
LWSACLSQTPQPRVVYNESKKEKGLWVMFI